MTREYIVEQIHDRCNVLSRKYYASIKNEDGYGATITPASAQQVRTKSKRDKSILTLVEELMEQCDGHLDLSDEAYAGLLYLIEPVNRHKGR